MLTLSICKNHLPLSTWENINGIIFININELSLMIIELKNFKQKAPNSTEWKYHSTLSWKQFPVFTVTRVTLCENITILFLNYKLLCASLWDIRAWVVMMFVHLFIVSLPLVLWSSSLAAFWHLGVASLTTWWLHSFFWLEQLRKTEPGEETGLEEKGNMWVDPPWQSLSSVMFTPSGHSVSRNQELWFCPRKD